MVRPAPSHYMPPMAADDDARSARLRKLTFRASRRGFLEADLILGPFARSHIHELDAEQLDEFERLLDVADQDLYGWIVGLRECPANWETPLVQRLRAFRLEAFAARTANA
jgi:antitoxin CptB